MALAHSPCALSEVERFARIRFTRQTRRI
jgi:hypothetical protein